MNISDTGTVIAIVIAVAAFISPIIVAVANNIHQTKMKKIEILSDYKLKAIEEYMSNLCKCHESKDKAKIEEYRKAYGTALLYVSDDTRKQMISFNAITEMYYSSDRYPSITTNDKITELCESLSKDMKIKEYT